MFCSLVDLQTESDVEQKLLWSVLTRSGPHGLGYSTAEVFTKTAIRQLEIGKGSGRKLYYPDYLVVLHGYPSLVVEAKAPSEPVEVGLQEARLYACELNALYPSGINPCERVVSCNGQRLLSCRWDSATPDVDLAFDQISAAAAVYAKFLVLAGRENIAIRATKLRSALKGGFHRALQLLGGLSVRNEAIGHNTFGATLSLDYSYLFNPTTREDRAYIARHAYVPSKRRERYAEPIDRLIRNVAIPSVRQLSQLEDTAAPRELTDALADWEKLEGRTVVLVGSVGAGKSTFIDYLTEVALPSDVLEKTVWARINLNAAPLAPQVAYDWISEQIADAVKNTRPDVDFDDITIVKKVYQPELKVLLKGALALLDPQSEAYRVRLADKILEFQANKIQTAKSLCRYVCGNARKLLVVCLDNCDKRTRDEQLVMFQLAQWVQREFRCLTFLPIRDITYEAHRHEPPLDTAIKDLTFRIEPPRFSDVLAKRVLLALAELSSRSRDSALEYTLPNGIRVQYPASDQGRYFASMVRSLYAHDRFVRRILAGLAGRNIRKAMEIFLEFCTSGHIGEDQIFKMRAAEGEYTVPFPIVARVLLRMNRRFYDGDQSYVKNVFQAEPSDAVPDNYVRLAILRWLEAQIKIKGPTGLMGFHRVMDLLSALVLRGHEIDRVRADCHYLLRAQCIVAEHQRTDVLSDEDLVILAPAGWVHLQLVVVPEYLAACAEDSWVADESLAQTVANKIGSGGSRLHYSAKTVRQLSLGFLEYLQSRWAALELRPALFATSGDLGVSYLGLEEAATAVRARQSRSSTVFVGNLDYAIGEPELVTFFGSRGFSPSNVRMVKSKATGKFTGVAFVTLASKEEAGRALDELDGTVFRGRALRLDEAEEDRAPAARHTTSVAPEIDPSRLALLNIPYHVSRDDLRQILSTATLRFTDIVVPRGEGGRNRGYAFAEFASPEDARNAAQRLHGLDIQGRTVAVRPATKRRMS